ncbi:MAG: hypothetical protein ABRQ37_28715 [Candidatus Eremiobacterota bacterium]
MLKIKRDISAMTLIEILVASTMGVVLIGLVYLAYRNIYSLSQIQKLETEFKQASGTAIQNMTSNIQNSYKKGANVYIDPNFIVLSPTVEKKVYDTTSTTAGDTLGIYLASKTRVQGGGTTLFKTFIRYGLRRIPGAPSSFNKGFALYREEREGLTNYTAPPAADPNFNIKDPNYVIMVGYYKNPRNYLAVSKLAFKQQGDSVITIYMQLVGSVSRGGGSVAKAIYNPSKSTFHTTSIQLKVESGEN